MSSRPLRLALNGFGRIGRSILRILLRDHPDYEVVLINDIEPLATCAYLFQYDSVYGPWPGQVAAGDGFLEVDGKRFPFHGLDDISVLDLSGVDVVLECTGLGGTRSVAERDLDSGCGKVLISGPSPQADITLVMGANEDQFAGERIVSNASCTTNALAPLLKILDDYFGIVGGQMTTVHCYTGSQPTVDKPRGDLARSRAAALSMVPTTTSAHDLVGQILPALKGRIQARAIRVPTASVSAIDLTVLTDKPITGPEAREFLKASAKDSAVLGWTDQPLVSSDLRGRPESLVLCGPEISVSEGGLLRVFGWYDNEWGFANRMLDMARLIAGSTGRE